MLEGRVTVNGATIRELGTKADPSTDDIRVDGRRIKLTERHRYILLNKPAARHHALRPAAATHRDGAAARHPRVRVSGRSPDFDTEGSVLLTNDGELAARSRILATRFRVSTRQRFGVPDPHDIERLSKGRHD